MKQVTIDGQTYYGEAVEVTDLPQPMQPLASGLRIEDRVLWLDYTAGQPGEIRAKVELNGNQIADVLLDNQGETAPLVINPPPGNYAVVIVNHGDDINCSGEAVSNEVTVTDA